MSKIHYTKEEAREFLRKEALSEICSVSDFNKFHDQVFCVFAKYGLQLEAKKEEFFSGEEWRKPECRDALIEKVKQFLDKHIK
ncbi:MAG: hypothetical protein KGD68_14205 [Candidatus Lokiarchaeota archaeon]|nr:hypothetical protein [Candidatus Lokiarchaeota archaeon]